MSAVAGLVNKNGKPVTESDLERMGDALNAHGLDSGEAWRGGAAGVLQRQTWVTLEDRQERRPLVAQEPRGVLVSASRLDNRAELAQELGIKAAQAHTAPDSFFLWRAYVRWADECPKHLLGDYTFAVWDEKIRRLFLAVSPLSSRPLHYHDSQNLFAFATMPKGLFALEEIPRALDEDYVARYLARLPRPPESTFYLGIRRVLPGQTLVVQGDQTVIRSFWDWEAGDEMRLSSDTEYEEAFLDLYTRVVRDHLRAAAPVGVMLSGGLDSSSLAAVAAPLLGAGGQRLAAFTEAPRHGFSLPSSASRYADEASLVQAIAGMYDNIDVTLLRPDGTHFLRDAGTYFRHAEVPFRNACNRPWIEAILCAAQAQGIRVLLMGSQGNLTISWKGEEPLPPLVRQGRWGDALREARMMAGNGKGGAPWKSLLRDGVLPTLPAPLQRAASRIKEYATGRTASPRPSLLRPGYAEKHGIKAKQGETAPPGSVQRHEWIRSTTAQSNSLWAGYEAMFGVEIRDPTADERIVRFCLALPPEQFYREGVSRRLIRRAMAGRLPAAILSGRRRGLQSADWRETLVEAQGELRWELDRMAQCGLADHLLDLAGLRRSLDELASAGRDGDPLDIGLRNYLEHGLMTGRFLSWFETGE